MNMFVGDMSLCRTMLPQHLASATLRDFELATHIFDASTTMSWAQKFPLVASFKINLSSATSDIALLGYAFSLWSRLSKFSKALITDISLSAKEAAFLILIL